MQTLVMKFGGAAFASLSQFAAIAKLITAKRREFSRIAVVVSAMGKTTDDLIGMAQEINPNPPQREYDMLISVGERITMSLLAMALEYENHHAISFTGSQSGIITNQSHSNAHIIDVRPHRLEASLNEGKIVIVAGFQGISETKEITTLGRGGSDTSAVALGLALDAQKVEFYKDVEGVFDRDPKICGQAKSFPLLTYDAALDIVKNGARILHKRAIQLAAKNALPLHVKSFISYDTESQGTIIIDPGKQRKKTPLYEGI